MLKIDEIKEIIKLVSELPIQHFEIEHESTKIIINKNDSLPINEKATEIHSSVEACGKGSKILEDEEVTIELSIVSPMLGTFYSSSEPGGVSFVKIGDKVNENTLVCILETMKLYNDIEAGIKGEIIEVLVKDGEFVEYGQPLFLVKPE